MNALHRDLEILVLKTEANYQEAKKKYRLKFHLMPKVGWLNDPNGLCQYQGIYHVFFQYSPFNVKGGVKTWGHYTSKDLLCWDYEGVSLLPDQPFDCHGVYSGSALIDHGNMELFYTGNIKYNGDFDYILEGRASNTIRIISKDGKHFERKQLLLKNSDYPKDYTCHIRDPKVWKDEQNYWMVLGARRKEDKGAVILYQSEDKLHWEFKKEISTKKTFGYMWECPDIFELDNTAILSISPQGLTSKEFCFQNLYQSGYFVTKEGTSVSEFCNNVAITLMQEEDFCEWDMGFDFYAPQTFEDEKGRRILIGWAGMPDVEDYDNQPTIEENWQHALTVPRQLKRKGTKVLQYPVKELLALRREQRELLEEQSYPIENGCFDLEVENPEGNDISIELDEDFCFQYNTKECDTEENGQIASISFEGEMGRGRKIRQAKTEKVTHVRILADTSLLEIYLNYGETVFTTRYYPQRETVILKIKKGGKKNNIWTIENKKEG